MENYREKYLFYKKKYIDLKKEIAQKQQGGGKLEPTYLNYGPNDGYVVDSDKQLELQLENRHKEYGNNNNNNNNKRQNHQSNNNIKLTDKLTNIFKSVDNIENTEDILGF